MVVSQAANCDKTRIAANIAKLPELLLKGGGVQLSNETESPHC